MDIIFDIGEIGWSCYHRAHLWWRYEHGEKPPQVQLWTLPDRFRFYEPFLYTELKEVPKKLQGGRRRNCFTCAGFSGRLFEGFGIDPSSVIHRFNCVRPPPTYKNKMIFKSFAVTDQEISSYNTKVKINHSCKNIVLIPRQKKSIGRNWGEQNWNDLIQILIDKLDYNIILCGLTCQTCTINIQSSRLTNLISDNPFIDTLCALNDSQTVLCATSQGFSGKLSLLQNINTLMWGHDKKRHTCGENWSTDPNIIYEFMDDRHYTINPQIIFNHIKQLLVKIDQ